MRIDANQPLPEVKPESVGRKGNAQVPEDAGNLQANASESEFAWSRIQQQLDRIGDVRLERVAKISQQLADGTYRVSGDAIASAMLNDLTS